MLRLRGAPFCTSAANYLDSDPAGRSEMPYIYVQIGAEQPSLWWFALVDTAAPWCVVDPALAEVLGLSTRSDTALSTRLGVVRGELHRVPLVLFADQGRALTVEATVFASSHWSGPNVIGYQGFLERVRFAIDPGAQRFYFGRL
jgi:hypothetical protein